ncbi:major facilitator superfamily transporter [Lecanosticta acicola]|uniref:Major facilitator superfamily transporter n=1 Tax=Lecanosticta acicola TaxID=111012 RepID=A0AAI8YYH9_9PEZI|nr:major facilitator superfamily transporter [Lecanosticta acicola]
MSRSCCPESHIAGRDIESFEEGELRSLLPRRVTMTNSFEKKALGFKTVQAETEVSSNGSTQKAKVPWYAYIWDYEPNRSKEERAFVQRLDISVLVILSLGYFIKNLDQTNISNAYVSGMKEDLKMNGDQLNLIDVAWTCGYVVGQIPSQIILTKVRPSVWIPSCELVWTILTFCIAATKTSNQVIAIRFFVGLVESIFYPAAHMILGSWYKPSELAKRACIFHASSAIASMFSGYLQAGVYKGLNGVQGLAGWQWLFVMDGIISAPIALAGLFLIPDLPENSKAFYLRKDQIVLAQQRMIDIGRAPRSRLGWSAWKRIFGRWHVYLLIVLYITFINTGPSSSVNPFSLWLKAEGYSVSLINIIPTTQYAVQAVSTVLFAVFSDYWRNRPAIMSVSTFWGLVCAIILAIWNVPSGLKWFAYEMTRASVPYGPIAMSWANEICGEDAEERTIVLGLMNAFGYAFNAWLPVLTYPTTDSPRFRKGFVFTSIAFLAQFAITWLVWWFRRRELRQKPAEAIHQDNAHQDTVDEPSATA